MAFAGQVVPDKHVALRQGFWCGNIKKASIHGSVKVRVGIETAV